MGADGEDGTIDVCDDDGNVTIRLSDETGVVECDDLDDTGVGGRAARQPLHNALARVLALQAVSYRTAGANGRKMPQIGLLGGDLEAVCPEVVSTLAEGRKAVNCSRLTTLLVEAVKEQQLLIDRQSALSTCRTSSLRQCGCAVFGGEHRESVLNRRIQF